MGILTVGIYQEGKTTRVDVGTPMGPPPVGLRVELESECGRRRRLGEELHHPRFPDPGSDSIVNTTSPTS